MALKKADMTSAENAAVALYGSSYNRQEQALIPDGDNYNQSFLPVMSYDGRVLGLVPIEETSFVGDEVDFVVPDVTGAVALASYVPALAPAGSTVSFMCVRLTREEELTQNWFNGTQSFIPFSRWVVAPGFAHQRNLTSYLLQFLKGEAMSGQVITVPPEFSAEDGVYTIQVEGLIANLQGCAFFDFNWVSLLNVETGNDDSATIMLGTPEGGVPEGVALTVVQSAALLNNSRNMNTLRFIKTSEAPIPAGNYSWPATVTNTSGHSVDVTITIVISSGNGVSIIAP